MIDFEGVAKTCFIAFFLLILGGCDKLHDQQQQRQAESADAVQVQSLDVYVDHNTMHVLTGEYRARDKARTLWHRRSADGGKMWTEPVRVDAGAPPAHGFERGNDAQIAAIGERLIAVWATHGSGWGGSGPLAAAVSGDGGKTWHARPNPADDDSTGGHAFIDLIADDKGMFHLVWLDSRSGSQGLRYTQSNDALTWIANRTLDSKTCECCWNTLFGSGEICMRCTAATTRGICVWLFPRTADSPGNKAIGSAPSTGRSTHARTPVARWRPAAMGSTHWSGPEGMARSGSTTCIRLIPARAGASRAASGANPPNTPISQLPVARTWRRSGTKRRTAIPRSMARDPKTAARPGPRRGACRIPAQTPRIRGLFFSSGAYRVFWTEGRKDEDTVWKVRNLGQP